jgi:hypothetical protein
MLYSKGHRSRPRICSSTLAVGQILSRKQRSFFKDDILPFFSDLFIKFLIPPYSGTKMSTQYFRFLLLSTNTWMQYFRFLLLSTNTHNTNTIFQIYPVEYKYVHTTNAIFQILLLSSNTCMLLMQYFRFLLLNTNTCIILMQFFRFSCWVQIHA